MKGHLDPPVRTEQPGTDDAAMRRDRATGQTPSGYRAARWWRRPRAPTVVRPPDTRRAGRLGRRRCRRTRPGRRHQGPRRPVRRGVAHEPRPRAGHASSGRRLDSDRCRRRRPPRSLADRAGSHPGPALPASPLNSSDADVRAVLDRGAATVFLRDAALRVPGVSRATIHLGRRRLAARAEVRFRDPSEVRADVSTALREQLDRLGLANPPTRISVRARHFRK